MPLGLISSWVLSGSGENWIEMVYSPQRGFRANLPRPDRVLKRQTSGTRVLADAGFLFDERSLLARGGPAWR